MRFYKILIMLGLPFYGLSIASQVEAASCQPIKSSYNQCTIDIPKVLNGDIKVVSNDTMGLFTGTAVASCKDGVLTIGKQTCKPKDETSCVVSPSSWAKNGSFCSHEGASLPVRDGAFLTLQDSKGNGAVSYSCNSGTLKTDSATCGNSAAPKQTSELLSLTTQAITQVTPSLRFFSQSDARNGLNLEYRRVRSEAISTCTAIQGMDDFSAVTFSFTRESTGGWLEYEANCPYSIDLRCDQGLVVAENVRGSYSNRTNEYSDPPDNIMLNGVCADRGYTSVDNILMLEQERSGGGAVVDSYVAVLVCSGNQATCLASPQSVPPRVVEAISCTNAVATMPMMEVPIGSLVSTSQFQTEVCTPLGFDGVGSISSQTKQDTVGGFDYYSVVGECTGYTQNFTAPLLQSCAPDSTIGSGGSDVLPVSCDAASVSGLVRGDRNPQSGLYNITPSPETIKRELCTANEYVTLDSFDIIEELPPEDLPTNSDAMYVVEAMCSDYSGSERAECGITGECQGEEVFPPVSFQTITGSDGKLYRYTCGALSVEPSSPICNGCVEPELTFTGIGETSGNTCTIPVSDQMSGGVETVEFFNADFNGVVDAYCNNGQRAVEAGGQAVCYKTCPGGVSVGWNDARGAQNCSNVVPAGSYRHDAIVNLGSSLSNTGSATARCDGLTGEWVIQSGTCLLDCNERSTWGSGISNSGVNKNNLCAASLADISHGQNGSMASNTFRTTGSATYSCNDGNISVSGGTCNVNCLSDRVAWASVCQDNVPELTSGSSRGVVHDSNPSYIFSSSISGSGTASCSDGRLSVSASCTYISRERVGTWGPWQEISRTNCVSTPTRGEVPEDQSFIQTTTCDVVYQRLQPVYYVWTDAAPSSVRVGRETFARNNVSTRNDVVTNQQFVPALRVVVSEGYLPWGNWVVTSTGSRNGTPFTNSAGQLEHYIYQVTTETRYRDYQLTYNIAPINEIIASRRDSQTRTSEQQVGSICYMESGLLEIVQCQVSVSYEWVIDSQQAGSCLVPDEIVRSGGVFSEVGQPCSNLGERRILSEGEACRNSPGQPATYTSTPLVCVDL